MVGVCGVAFAFAPVALVGVSGFVAAALAATVDGAGVVFGCRVVGFMGDAVVGLDVASDEDFSDFCGDVKSTSS